MSPLSMKKRIRDFYIEAYSADVLGQEINRKATFEGLLETLEKGRNVYEYIGVGDSVVRERLFMELARMLHVNYNYIYYKWLR